MESTTFTTMASDGTALFTYRWLPEGPPRAIVQIAHGMAEHAARYARFAEVLTGAGYAVYANDHRGHGQTSPLGPDHGYFADDRGFAKVVADLHVVTEHARAEQPGLPVFLFGHSMGSFLSRAYIADYGAELTGVVLSATAGDQGVLGKVGRGIALAESKALGRRHVSPVMDKLSFGKFNASFKPARTAFDWLSRDDAEVDKYVADPLCGNTFTAGFYVDLLDGLTFIHSASTSARVPKSLPIHLIAGSQDPVGDNTKGVEQVAKQYRKAGIEHVTTRYYLDARHELLNETNRDEIMADIVAWFDAHLNGA